MLSNYLKTAWRTIRRHPGYSLINVFGLAVGLASCITILLWVRDEVSYDRFHVNAGSIHRVIAQAREPGGGSESFAVLPPSLGPALKAEFPEILQSARHLYVGQQIVSRGEKRFYEKKVSLVDPDFLRMFSFPLRRGDALTALSIPHAVVLTESAAAKYFGSEEPLGKALRLNNRSDCVVSGILADIPAQSHLSFDILLPLQDAGDFGFPTETWERFSYETYVLLSPRTDARRLQGKISSRLHQPLGNSNINLRLQPLTDIHLRSASIDEGEVRGDIDTVLLFSLLAVFILLMACINYLNLTTAQGGARAKEIGLRKVNGAKRREIIVQFLGESVLQAALAMIIALALVVLSLPLLNSLSGKAIGAGVLFVPSAWLPLLGFLLATGLLAGIYPAWYLSHFTPAAVLKGKIALGAGGSRFRKLLVVFQFSLTILLIVASVGIYRQLRFLRTRAVGFDKEQVLMVPLRGDLVRRVEPLKAEILRNSSVASASAASDPVMMFGTTMIMDDWEGRKPGEEMKCSMVRCDEDFLKTHGIEMAQGRFFSKDMGGNLEGKIVISESAVRALGLVSPLGKRLDRREIVGVVRDFHARSLHSAIGPVALVYDPGKFAYLFVKIKPGNTAEALATLAGTWKRAAPDHPFDFSFLDQQIDKLYRADRKLAGVVNGFTLLALLVANLGLLGMASYMTDRRWKEIGIRKVLGASMPQIVVMLSREFIQWVALATILAWPAALFLLRQWLQAFAYRLPVGIGIFVLSSLLALLLALATVSYHSIRAARANPVDSLRYE
ncbi:MAG: ABC transporter permease [Candidatus Aminicenantes bacterium]|nr:ABC transporter permease [Candidatus Aminicenantes bacterium]